MIFLHIEQIHQTTTGQIRDQIRGQTTTFSPLGAVRPHPLSLVAGLENPRTAQAAALVLNAAAKHWKRGEPQQQKEESGAWMIDRAELREVQRGAMGGAPYVMLISAGEAHPFLLSGAHRLAEALRIEPRITARGLLRDQEMVSGTPEAELSDPLLGAWDIRELARELTDLSASEQIARLSLEINPTLRWNPHLITSAHPASEAPVDPRLAPLAALLWELRIDSGTLPIGRVNRPSLRDLREESVEVPSKELPFTSLKLMARPAELGAAGDALPGELWLELGGQQSALIHESAWSAAALSISRFKRDQLLSSEQKITGECLLSLQRSGHQVEVHDGTGTNAGASSERSTLHELCRWPVDPLCGPQHPAQELRTLAGAPERDSFSFTRESARSVVGHWACNFAALLSR